MTSVLRKKVAFMTTVIN